MDVEMKADDDGRMSQERFWGMAADKLEWALQKAEEGKSRKFDEEWQEDMRLALEACPYLVKYTISSDLEGAQNEL